MAKNQETQEEVKVDQEKTLADEMLEEAIAKRKREEQEE